MVIDPSKQVVCPDLNIGGGRIGPCLREKCGKFVPAEESSGGNGSCAYALAAKSLYGILFHLKLSSGGFTKSDFI